MKIQLNTNLLKIFNGTYESMWEVDITDDSGDQLPTNYDHKDLMRSIAEAYQSQELNILSELDIPWIKSIKFTGDYYSPREYNFLTDTLDFTIDINKTAMLKVLRELKNNKEFEDYLRENFTSRDGFWSYTPNNYPELVEQIKTEGDEFCQSLGALITFLVNQKNKSIDGDYYSETIEFMVYDYWRSNDYSGLEYQVCEHKIDGWGCNFKKCFNYEPQLA